MKRLAREASENQQAQTQAKIAELRKPLAEKIAEAAVWTEKQSRRPAPRAPASPSHTNERADLRRLTSAGAKARLRSEQGHSDAQDGWYEIEFEGMSQYEIGGT